MINTPFSFSQALDILLIILTTSGALCIVRLYLGPTVPNRNVAFDAVAIHAVAILALYAVRIDAPSILDVALVTAVLGFLGTTMTARYLERSGGRYYALYPELTNRRIHRRPDRSAEQPPSPVSSEKSDSETP